MIPITRALTGTVARPELTFERSYRASPADVWSAWTDPARAARWLGTIEGDPRGVGDTFTIDLGGVDDIARCRVRACTSTDLEVDWTWQDEAPSVLTVRVQPDGPGRTKVTLHHALGEPEHTTAYGGGWERLLQSLSRSLAEPADVPNDEVEAAAVQTWTTMVETSLALEHVVAAPPEQVWSAWTSTAGLRSWWWRHWDDVEITADVQVGGDYRIHAPAAGITLTGTYLAVDEPGHLAFSWRWQDSDGAAPDEAVDVRFAPVEAGTAISIRHTGPWTSDAPARSYGEGWDAVVGQLQAVLAG